MCPSPPDKLTTINAPHRPQVLRTGLHISGVPIASVPVSRIKFPKCRDLPISRHVSLE